MELSEIKRKIEIGYYNVPVETPKVYKSNHIEDEEKSVRWNREFLEMAIKDAKQIRRNNQKARDEKFYELQCTIIEIMYENYSSVLNINQVKRIVEKQFSEHSSWLECLDYIQEEIEYIEEIMEIK